ncbi:MAG: DUF3021 domain-containing protein [Ruminococcaceae bacterium]|nr:DUF3021 domain-containing protein [Oscillospiraceae bacterium]
MNRHVKIFLHRGLLFAGFGPIVLGIVYLILGATLNNFSLSGWEVLLGIISTYLLAFIQAGASVFNQIESWPIAKSLGIHFLTLFAAYSLCYIANAWIPFEPMVLLIFCAAFVVTYLVIWFTVYLCAKNAGKRFNRQLGEQ